MDFISHVEDGILYKKCQDLLEDPRFQFLSDVKISTNNKCWRYNKILFYLQYPFLAVALKDCDLIIFGEKNTETSLDNSGEEPHILAHDVCDKESPAEVTVDDVEKDIFTIKSSDNLSYASQGAYLCPHCGKSFGEIQKFKDHCGRNPSREIPMCSVCQRTFCSPGKLKQHQAIHEDGGKLECTICLKRFKCHRNLQQHYKHHTEKIEFKCNHCLKMFSSLFNLNRHKNRRHNSA